LEKRQNKRKSLKFNIEDLLRSSSNKKSSSIVTKEREKYYFLVYNIDLIEQNKIINLNKLIKIHGTNQI